MRFKQQGSEAEGGAQWKGETMVAGEVKPRATDAFTRSRSRDYEPAAVRTAAPIKLDFDSEHLLYLT